MKRVFITTFLGLAFLLIQAIPSSDANASSACQSFVIPFAPITIDGNPTDWASIPPVFTDQQNDNYNPPDGMGTDLKSFYMARDEHYLYLMITLYDGNPGVDLITQYGFQANQTHSFEQPDDHLAKAYFETYDKEWYSGVHVRSTTGGGDIAYYPAEYVATGEKLIEWKVALPDMGVLDGKYVNVYIHCADLYGKWFEVSDFFYNCIQIFMEEPLVDNPIIIDGCDTKVVDQVYNGKYISSWIGECETGSNNHGEFMRCLTKLCSDLKKDGNISGEDFGAIVSCAAKSDVP
jgi:hypothetical protein